MASETAGPLLNFWQRRLVAAAVTIASVAVVLLGIYGVFLLLKTFIDSFRDVLLPLAVATILATLLRPGVALAEARLKLSRGQAVAAVFLLILVAMAGLMWVVVPAMITAVVQLFGVLQEEIKELIAWAEKNYPQFAAWAKENDIRSVAGDMIGWGSEALQEIGGQLRDVGGGLASFFGSAAMWLVTPIYLAILLYTQPKQFDRLRREVTFIPLRYRDDLLFLVKQFNDILFAFFRGQFTIAFLTGIILAVGFQLIGMKAGLLVGFIAGMSNLIPYLGTTAGVLTLLPYAYFQEGGGLGLLILTIIVFAGTQFFQDYVMTPRIMGERTGLGPMTIIFGIFFWGVALDGLLGVLLAIPLTAFFIVFWRLARERYLPDFTRQRAEGPPACGNETPT
ncbi:MAG: AI-2E family transporter [Opitutales bacterium]